MAKPKNHIITSKDQSELVRLKEEYDMIGRETKLEQGKLTIFALPQKRNREKSKRK
jgi:hypothetical protein